MAIRQLQYFHVDTFTEVPFKGSPTGVILLEEDLTDGLMQAIAAELNHTETAFIRRGQTHWNLNVNHGGQTRSDITLNHGGQTRSDITLNHGGQTRSNITLNHGGQTRSDATLNHGGQTREDCAFYELRWFTPEVEVQLSGSATLAAAKVLHQELGEPCDCIQFSTRFGQIFARRRGEDLIITLPMDDYEALDPSEQVLWYLGIDNYQRAVYSRKLQKLMIEVEDEVALSRVKPDFNKLRNIDLDFDLGGLCITCRRTGPGDYDFASRYFNPWIGVDEDTITGSMHTVLALYWSRELSKRHLVAIQSSRRSGRLILDVRDGGIVDITGRAYVTMEGKIRLPV